MSETTVFESPGDLAEQFDDLGQQKESATLGMWIFLATEVLLFGALFLGYTIYRLEYHAAFEEASKHLYMSLGSINTGVLLGSSLAVALAVHSAEKGHNRGIVIHLLIAIGLGIVFLLIKSTEYYLEYREHLVPWYHFRFEEAHPEDARLFFVFYFFMTGLHALHMLAGLSVLTVITILAARGRFSEAYHNPVEMAGLYWHFVDIVWVFLLPTLYLVNPH